MRSVLIFLGAILLSATTVRADFVANNLRFTLYHELGHAVIDQMALPVFGPQENAADSFGIVLADRLLSEAQMRDLITDVTALARLDAAEEIFDSWDEYMPGSQRLARAICLYYGLAPLLRLETARALGMPASSERDCEADADAVNFAWSTVLDRMRPDENSGLTQSLRRSGRGKAILILQDDIDRINALVKLPRPIPVRQVDCAEVNAFYFDIDERIEFCSEMVGDLRARMPR